MASLDQIYDEQEALRAKMAETLVSVTLWSWVTSAHRVDYHREDVQRFREQVRDEVVPLVKRIKDRQAEALGLEKLMSWDEGTYRPEGNPRPQGEEAWMTEQAKTMFRRLHPEIDDFFKMMVDRDLLDLSARSGKAGGGFCTSFPNYDVPFICQLQRYRSRR